MDENKKLKIGKIGKATWMIGLTLFLMLLVYYPIMTDDALQNIASIMSVSLIICMWSVELIFFIHQQRNYKKRNFYFGK